MCIYIYNVHKLILTMCRAAPAPVVCVAKLFTYALQV